MWPADLSLSSWDLRNDLSFLSGFCGLTGVTGGCVTDVDSDGCARLELLEACDRTGLGGGTSS